MSFPEAIFDAIGDGTWGWSLIPFLVVLGVFFTLASGPVQFRFFGRMFRVLFPGGQPEPGQHVSSREALLVSVGGRVGGKNFAGVAPVSSSTAVSSESPRWPTSSCRAPKGLTAAS